MHPSQLPRELVVLILGHLVHLHTTPDAQAEGQQRPPLLTAHAAAAVAAAASVHTWWRAACLAEVRCWHNPFVSDFNSNSSRT